MGKKDSKIFQGLEKAIQAPQSTKHDMIKSKC